MIFEIPQCTIDMTYNWQAEISVSNLSIRLSSQSLHLRLFLQLTEVFRQFLTSAAIQVYVYQASGNTNNYPFGCTWSSTTDIQHNPDLVLHVLTLP